MWYIAEIATPEHCGAVYLGGGGQFGTEGGYFEGWWICEGGLGSGGGEGRGGCYAATRITRTTVTGATDNDEDTAVVGFTLGATVGPRQI